MRVSLIPPDTFKLWRGSFYFGISPTRKKKFHVRIKCVVRSMAAMICSKECGKIGYLYGFISFGYIVVTWAWALKLLAWIWTEEVDVNLKSVPQIWETEKERESSQRVTVVSMNSPNQCCFSVCFSSAITEPFLIRCSYNRVLLNHNNGLYICREVFPFTQEQNVQACWSPAVLFAVFKCSFFDAASSLMSVWHVWP